MRCRVFEECKLLGLFKMGMATYLWVLRKVTSSTRTGSIKFMTYVNQDCKIIASDVLIMCVKFVFSPRKGCALYIDSKMSSLNLTYFVVHIAVSLYLINSILNLI